MPNLLLLVASVARADRWVARISCHRVSRGARIDHLELGGWGRGLGAVSCSALRWIGRGICLVSGFVLFAMGLVDVGVGKVCARREVRPVGGTFVRREGNEAGRGRYYTVKQCGSAGTARKRWCEV